MSNISVHSIEGKRILCTADVRGKQAECVTQKERERRLKLKKKTLPGHISELNRLAREFNAHYIIHTGDFGFYGKLKRDTGTSYDIDMLFLVW